MLCRCIPAAAQRIFSGNSAENVYGVMKMKEKIPREFPELPHEPELRMGLLYDPLGMGVYPATEEGLMEYALMDEGYRDIF